MEVVVGAGQKAVVNFTKSIDYACRRCGAPAKFMNDERIRYGFGELDLAKEIDYRLRNGERRSVQQWEIFKAQYRKGWPEMYVDATDPRRDVLIRDVIMYAQGDHPMFAAYKDMQNVCQCCGLPRPAPKNRRLSKIDGLSVFNLLKRIFR